jgi:sensor histidine kinase YesM
MIREEKTYSPLSHQLAVLLSLSFSLLFIFFLLVGFVYFENETNSGGYGPTTVLDFVVRFTACASTFYILYELCFWMFRKKWKNRNLHLAVGLFGTLGAAMLISPVISKIMLQIFRTVEYCSHHRFISLAFIRDLMAAVIVYLSTISIITLVRNHQAMVENRLLIAENIRNRYEALKHQLNPHFLFNTLNTLDGLIGFDDNRAHEYLQNLSSSFRYTIQNKEITTLEEELDFVKSYAYLMKIRYGDNLDIHYAIDEKFNRYFIMPVTLQLLIENAVKHNVINDKHPLSIRIETTARDTVRVTNPIIPKVDAKTDGGIGLANLVERYSLLFGLEVKIAKTGVFAVEIPLISKL